MKLFTCDRDFIYIYDMYIQTKQMLKVLTDLKKASDSLVDFFYEWYKTFDVKCSNIRNDFDHYWARLRQNKIWDHPSTHSKVRHEQRSSFDI